MLAVVLGTAALVLGCGGSGGSGNSGHDVTVADFSFAPELTTVKVGATVVWTNEGQVAHTVKGRGFFSSNALDHGASFRHRFTKAGRFPYLCTLHPTQMRGTVVVQG
jgi:plastocyanin